MNKPKRMGKDNSGNLNYRLHRFGALGFFDNVRNPNKQKSYGRPIRKASRQGKPKGLNKTGHRHNRG